MILCLVLLSLVVCPTTGFRVSCLRSSNVRKRFHLRQSTIILRAQKAEDGGLGETLDAAVAQMENREMKGGGNINVRRARALWRIGWLSWWSQVILSVVSAVVLAFARAVIPRTRIDPLLGGGILFSTLGLGVSFFSIAWSWHYTRLSRRDVSVDKIRSALRFGILVNLTGMLLTIISAEQIVGGLIAKLLLTPGSIAQLSTPTTSFRPVAAPLTALDVFIVQANTNTLASHLAGLIASLYLLARSRVW
mmetsp:Transcript_2645/g.3591  ORF Transcript_2645/g.3591 Transcript_2645/m.3591 type:complete len:249 (+) Transcript_2645:23-769(+)